ncbi:hypothetical protein KCTC52924_02951 [Arenibacter antarcticus]|uniref:MauE/DoxX family redox-associated membrane protein n=1 Tax=Arenibacter antarcticus TaxID=2040469 RepID=A0ABW5VFQ2_9FLAO|nr:MauE/DoxX family redox-associated membrane protein [Arenibacter sp. H213]MCM4167369.1 hypothetical protein [Arenibacter sp. H213]
MKWQQKHTWILLEIISLVFILLFAYAGLTKLLEGHLFYDNIRNSPVFGGEKIAYISSWFVPIAEIMTALLIVWRKTRLIGLYGALSLMILFTIYTVAIVFFSPYTPCSCGGVISLLSWEQHLVFNVVFLGLALLGSILSHKERKKWPHPESYS